MRDIEIKHYLIAMTSGYSDEPLAVFGFIQAPTPKEALAEFERGLGETVHHRLMRVHRKQYVAIEAKSST
ncbi:MAG: hypothetical protein JWM78_464 [Verrucomicrobiaceae bacterium]|nr:hypothetical protein [Verrucomicrobiaceae bacterium]